MKSVIKEYFEGNPDTIYEYDDETNNLLGVYRYDSSPGFSFGWFQTSLDGGKEFVAKYGATHEELTQEIGRKIVGKASHHIKIDEYLIIHVGTVVNWQGAYRGRTFSKAKVITTYYKVSSEKLREILENLGGAEKFKDYKYVFPKMYVGPVKEGVCVNVIEYINSNDTYEERRDINNMEKDIKDEFKLQPWFIEAIRDYNNTNAPTKLSMLSSKLGDMPIAKYNWLKNRYRGENKMSRKTIKENNMKKNSKYAKEFSNYMSIMNEALKKNDFAVYEYAKNMLDETIDDCKKEKELMSEVRTTNFGRLNHIFEEALPTLMKTNKNAVKNVIKTIKEDKNLKSEFNFYNLIKNYNSNLIEGMSSDDTLKKIEEITYKNINKKTIKESNKKLMNVMIKNGITPISHINEEYRKLYDSGNKLLVNEAKMTNFFDIQRGRNNIIKYMDAHKNDVIKEDKSPEKLISDYENKLKENLTESEISFVQQITDFRTPIAEQRKEKLFNKFKNECIDKINEMLKENSENSELIDLKKQLEEQKFNKETIVKDIAKLLEIRDILMDD